jgi:hypothetical protein
MTPPDRNQPDCPCSANHAEIERLKARLVNAERIIDWYAQDENYHEDMEVKFPFRSTKVEADRGARAREFLAEKAQSK